jgi:hypothetical protein
MPCSRVLVGSGGGDARDDGWTCLLERPEAVAILRRYHMCEAVDIAVPGGGLHD